MPRHGYLRSATITIVCLFLAFGLAAMPVHAARWQVGPGRMLALPSQAAAAANDGDTIDIDAGSYVDCATWTRNDLLIRGAGGYAHVRDKACGGKAIWIVQGRNTTVEWVEFSGASVTDKNGAGIRLEGPDLTVRHCLFHDNEEGILAGDNAASSVLVEYSEFDHNGYGDGYSHNIYINHVARLTVRFCYFHRAVVGHEIKSRAFETYVLYNRISTEADGTASRNVDLPNGGFALLLGNVVEHGPNTQNSNLCEFGLEGLSNPRRSLVVASNTFVTERGAGSFLNIPASGTDTVLCVNNIFAGRASFLVGSCATLDTAGNVIERDPAQVGFADASNYDYRLLPQSPAVDAGIDPGSFDGIALLPSSEYIHPANGGPRAISGALDAGAFELAPVQRVADGAAVPAYLRLESIAPNPCRGRATVTFGLARASRVRIGVWTTNGDLIERVSDGTMAAGRHLIGFSLDDRPSGVYVVRIETAAGTVEGMVTVLR